jgi:hypothetical protein
MKLTLGLTTLVLALTAQAAGTGWAQLPPDEFVGVWF